MGHTLDSLSPIITRLESWRLAAVCARRWFDYRLRLGALRLGTIPRLQIYVEGQDVSTLSLVRAARNDAPYRRVGGRAGPVGGTIGCGAARA